MKFKTFKKLLLELKDFHNLSQDIVDVEVVKNKDLTLKLLNNHINRCIKSISKDFGDDTLSTIKWLFESLIDGEQGSFEFNGREYDGSIENVYNHLKGKLKPSNARIIEIDVTERIYFPHTKEVDDALYGIDYKDTDYADQILRAHGVKR